MIPGQRELALRLVDFGARAGLVFHFRDYLPGEALALLALFGAFTEAHVSVVAPGSKIARVEQRVWLTLLASLLSQATVFFTRVPYPLLVGLAAHVVWTHSAALGTLWRVTGAARRRRRAIGSGFAEASIVR